MQQKLNVLIVNNKLCSLKTVCLFLSSHVSCLKSIIYLKLLNHYSCWIIALAVHETIQLCYCIVWALHSFIKAMTFRIADDNLSVTGAIYDTF